MGLVPLHVWLPIAHPAAPMPASAVLSGAIIKSGAIGLIRFLPFEGGVADWSAMLTGLGLATAFYAVAVGITQGNPKTVLAYSSVSQMGFVAAVLGAGSAGSAGVATAAAFYAAHHVLAKGALFLAVGVAAATGARLWWPVLLPAAVLALGFGGLPLTGGALAKLAVKAPLGEGVVGTLATLAAAGSTLLMLHFLHRLRMIAAPDLQGSGPPGLVWPWLGMAFAAVAVPWALFLSAGIGTLADVLAPSALWEMLWPVLLGGALAVGLRHFSDRVPRVPEGDVVVLGAPLARAGAASGAALERAESVLRLWPVAGLSLLMLTLMLGAALVSGID
jgi:multicomponent Na+:H+ antiporter subunit A